MGQEERGLSPSIVVGRVLDCVMLDKLRGCVCDVQRME